MDVGDYLRIEGKVALNTTEDVFIIQHRVEKATISTYEYEYMVSWIWVEDERGDAVLVLFDRESQTKPGRHDGDYHRGDQICIGGHVTKDGSGIVRVRSAFVARHQNDTPAIFWEFFVAAIIIGLTLMAMFVVMRMFLNPRKREAPDWRGL
jgi:hypothetical protein